MVEVLDEILLSENPLEKFYDAFGREEFRSWLLDILPEVEACKNLKQDNPWHIYNCLDHILHSVEEINKLSVSLSPADRRMLAYTMFLHDIGKPACYIRRYSRLYKREVDSFFNHNLESKKVASRVLPRFNFTPADQKKIEMLIEMHDIFMFITLKDDGNRFHHVLTPQYLAEQISALDKVGDGKVLMKQLVMVGTADNKAQNPKMTQSSLHILEVIDQMLK